MSQRPPKKNRSGKSSSRKTRSQSTPRVKATPQAQAEPTAQPQSARTANATESGGKPSERRQSRREAAIRKEQQKKQMRLIIGGIAAAVIVATVLILLNRPTNDAADINYEGIAIAQPPIHPAQGPIARVTQENVVPQSGSTRFSAANAPAMSSIGRKDTSSTPGACTPTSATIGPRTAARE